MGLLTDRQIQSASHRPTEYFLSDGDRLYLRVRPMRKVWVYRYKQDGRVIKLGLGRHPVVSLAVARQKARSLAEKRACGIAFHSPGRPARSSATWRGVRKVRATMSENTANSALRTLGYEAQEDITGHVFRATARTLAS